MAEIGVVASIVGIVGAALSLSKKLYEFGSTTSVAAEHVDFVAKNVTNYALALELLADRFDDDDPVHSNRAIRVVEILYDQSYDLFDRIEDMLPEPKNSYGDLSLSQKLAWNFKRKNVEFLATQIEYLKTTASLLATILFSGTRIRARRTSYSKRTSKADRVDVARDKTRINVAVIEQVEACNKLADLRSQKSEDQQATRDPTNGDEPKRSDNGLSNGLTMLPNSSVETFLTLPVYREGRLGTERQAVIDQVDNISQELLSQYTNIDREEGRKKERDLSQGLGLLTQGISSVLDLSDRHSNHIGDVRDVQEGYTSKSHVQSVGQAGSVTDLTSASTKPSDGRRAERTVRFQEAELYPISEYDATHKTSTSGQKVDPGSSRGASAGSWRRWNSGGDSAAQSRKTKHPNSTHSGNTSSLSQRSRRSRSMQSESILRSGGRNDMRDSARLTRSERRSGISEYRNEGAIRSRKDVQKSNDTTERSSIVRAADRKNKSVKADFEKFLAENPSGSMEFGAICGMLVPESVPMSLGEQKTKELVNMYVRMGRAQHGAKSWIKAKLEQRADEVITSLAQVKDYTSPSKHSESESVDSTSESESGSNQDGYNQPARARLRGHR